MTTDEHIRPWYREFWPWFIIAILALSLIGGLLLTWLAFDYSDDPVIDNYYQQGLQINRQLDQDRLAGALDVRATLMMPTTGNVIRVDLQGRFATLPATLHLAFAHPSRGTEDTTVTLALGTSGYYEGVLPHVMSGRWYLQLTGQTSPRSSFRLSGTLDLDRYTSIVLTSDPS